MKTILILLDTTRKDMLSIYNENSDVKTPNLNSLAENSYIFDNHCTGSLPCMPARRDLFTGRLDFFERPWGALEPFDQVLQKELSINGIPSHLITDHAHYWRHGGENYMQYFDTFIMNRGQESDPYQSYIDEAHLPEKVHGRYNLQYYKNCEVLNVHDYPVVQTFNDACEFIEKNKNEADFYLQIEGFDPHEPFSTPQKYYDMYNLNDLDELYNSPKYGQCNDSPKQIEHITKRYKANLTFADDCLGKLLSMLKQLGIYDECNIIFTTDHGFHLGDHDSLGKGVTHIYNEICEIPYLHKFPNQKCSERIEEFTQNIDVMPTLLDMYKVDGEYHFHGTSYLPLINNQEYTSRQAIISGYFGHSIVYKDAKYTYFKCKKPLVEEHVLTAVPRIMQGYMGSKYAEQKIDYSSIEMGRYLPHTDYPVYKFKTSFPDPKLNDEIYLSGDKCQTNNILTQELSVEYEQKLKNILDMYEANEFYKSTLNFSIIDD